MASDNPILRQFARSLSRSGVLPSRAARIPRNEKVKETPPEPEVPTFIYGEASDNWEPQHQPRVQKILEQRSVPKGQAPDEPEKKKGKKVKVPESESDMEHGTETIHVMRVVKKAKKRNISMSLCVSEEEEHIIREYLVSKDKTFSNWARETLFKAIGRSIPVRPNKDR